MRDQERLLGVGNLKFDTTTNGRMGGSPLPAANGTLPEVMVAYKDNQAYPEYLITFSMDGRNQ